MRYAAPASLVEVHLNPGGPPTPHTDIPVVRLPERTAARPSGGPRGPRHGRAAAQGRVAADRRGERRTTPTFPSHWSPSCPSRTSCRPSQ